MNGFSADGYIIDQDAFSDYEYRTLPASINGCGGVALFNVQRAAGRERELGEILRELDSLHRFRMPGPTAMPAMRRYIRAHLPELRELVGREQARAAARCCRMGILRYTEAGVPHFISFLREADGSYRFFNVNDGLEDFTADMDAFFATHVGQGHYVSAFVYDGDGNCNF